MKSMSFSRIVLIGLMSFSFATNMFAEAEHTTRALRPIHHHNTNNHVNNAPTHSSVAKQNDAPCVMGDCCGHNSLTLHNICSERGNISCLDADTLNSNSICASIVNTDQLCTDQMSIDMICTNSGNIKNAMAETVVTNTLCAQAIYSDSVCFTNVAAEDVCVTGTLKHCGNFTAIARATPNTVYTLGDPVPFDDVISDPSNSLVQLPTRYVAQESGNYLLTVQIVQNNLSGSGLILGTPMADVEVYVNGFLRRQDFSPYLSFNNEQTTLVTTLISLNAGDELLVRYNVLIIDGGVNPYVGTITLLGSPISFQGLSTFIYVEYLSSTCPTDCPNTACAIDCGPVAINCQPCASTQCVPCCPQV